MTQNYSGQPGGPATPGMPRHDLRNLRRSNDDRMIAGVCGGLGRHTGIDPIVFRIVLVALAVFGGIGLVLYALAWLLVPEENATTSEAHRIFQGGLPSMLVAAVIAVIGIVILIDFAYHWANGRVPVLIIAAVVVVILLSRRAGSAQAPNPASGPTGGFFGSPPTSPPPAAAPFAGAPAPVATPAPFATTAPYAAAPPPAYTTPLGPPAGYAPSRPIYVPAPAKPPKPPRPPSILGPLALSAGIVVIGALFALDAAHTIDISAQAVFAAALLTVGIALVVGAWIGRARALIAVGVILTVGLAVTAALDVPLRGGIGTHNDTPLALSELPAAYHLGIGNETIDLTALKTGGKTVHVAASVGLGQLRVVVPGNAVVKVHGRVGAGDLRLNGTVTNGTHLNRNVVFEPQEPTVVAAGELDLDLQVGVGDVEVVQLPSST